MNNQMPYFIPMYPQNNQNNNEYMNKLNYLEKKINELENRLDNLEKSKMIKLDNDYTTFQNGYMV